MMLRSASTTILRSQIPVMAAAAASENPHEASFNMESSASKIPRVPSIKSPSSLSSLSISCSAANNINKHQNYSRTNTNAVIVDDEGCIGNGGSGKRCSDSHNNDDDDNHDDRIRDAYYQSMIQADPGNSLVLGNYAKFLKEVRRDVTKAQEYCERAIVADQKDGDVLSLYAEILWEQTRDVERANAYFDRATQASPDDCYVMASYARFLWEAEEEEDARPSAAAAS